MGGITSRMQKKLIKTKSEFDIQLDLVRPDYYIRDVVLLPKDIESARYTWDLIMTNRVERYYQEKKSIEFTHCSCLTWFFDMFYSNLFEFCPEVKPLFAHTNMITQGKKVAAVITTALDLVYGPKPTCKEVLTKLANDHNGRGIKSEYYGVLGKALLSTLETILGTNLTPAGKTSWIRIYCVILDFLLPVVVKYEMEERSIIRRSCTALSLSLSSHQSQVVYVASSAASAVQSLRWNPMKPPFANINEI